jgi:hypothetical protein
VVLFLLFLVRLNIPFLRSNGPLKSKIDFVCAKSLTTIPASSLEDFKQASSVSEGFEKSRTSSSTHSSDFISSFAHISRATYLPENAKIWAIIEVSKAENGVDALLLVEWSPSKHLGLTIVDWQQLKGRAEVETLLDKNAHDLAETFSVIHGAYLRAIFARGLDELFSRKNCEVLLNGGKVSCDMLYFHAV